jgi:hypothetical protein
VVERNVDGTLKVIYQMPDNDGWLREGGEEFRTKVMEEQERLNRFLTDEEKEEIRRSLTTE